jgi:hypothetical protein
MRQEKGARVAIAALLMLGLVAGRARAADESEGARDHVRKARRSFDVGHFADAAHEFELAYAANGNASLLFDLGEAHRLAGERAEAVIAYQAYLRNLPRTQKRAEVEQRLEELQPPPPDPPLESAPPPVVAPSLPAVVLVAPPPPRHSKLLKKWWLWTAVGVVAAAAVTGIAVGVTQAQPRETSFLVKSP